MVNSLCLVRSGADRDRWESSFEGNSKRREVILRNSNNKSLLRELREEHQNEESQPLLLAEPSLQSSEVFTTPMHSEKSLLKNQFEDLQQSPGGSHISLFLPDNIIEEPVEDVYKANGYEIFSYEEKKFSSKR